MAYDGLTGSGGCQQTADGVFGTTPRVKISIYTLNHRIDRKHVAIFG